MNSQIAPRGRARNFIWSVCATVLLCVPAVVSAQTVYRQIDVEGRVTYSDRPGTTPLPPAIPALDVANALASNSPMPSRSAAIIDANEAMRRLGQAELERKEGAERLSGEQARSGDASEANQRYRQRQEELRRAVEYAQRRSDKTDRTLRAIP